MTLQQFNVTGPQSLQGLVSCCADPWPLGAAVPSRQLVVLWDGGSGGETWPLGIHLGSGGKEWVIGLRATFSVLIGRKGVRRWEKREIDRERERERGEEVYPLQHSLAVPAQHTLTQTEDCDVTAYQRNTACSSGDFFLSSLLAG